MFKIEWNRRFTTIAAYAFIVLAGAILFYLGVNNFDKAVGKFLRLINPIKPILYGIVIAYLLNPIMNFYEKKVIEPLLGSKKIGFKLCRTLGLLLTYISATIVVVGFLMIIIPRVALSISRIVSKLPDYVALAEGAVNELFQSIPPGVIPQDYVNMTVNMVKNTIEALFGTLKSMVPAIFNFTMGVTSGIFRVIMALIVSIYALASKEKFCAQVIKIMYAFMARSTVTSLTSVGKKAHGMFGGFISGKIVDSMIIGVICFAGLSLMKMPNVILVSFIIGVTNIIPFFGPFFGAIPSFFFILLDSPTQAYIFIVFIIILQQIDGNIIGPLILGDSTGLPAFWVVFAILLFGGLFGVPGMIIGVPAFGLIYWLAGELITLKLSNKNMPTDTESYTKPIVLPIAKPTEE